MTHPNTLKFLRLMDEIDYKKFNKEHPKEDIGQYVRRLSEEDGNIEGDDPSDKAIEIMKETIKQYPKEREQ